MDYTDRAAVQLYGELRDLRDELAGAVSRVHTLERASNLIHMPDMSAAEIRRKLKFIQTQQDKMSETVATLIDLAKKQQVLIDACLDALMHGEKADAP